MPEPPPRVQWRAQASRNFEALLDNVRQALAEDLDVLDERLAACRAAVKAAGEERREAIDALVSAPPAPYSRPGREELLLALLCACRCEMRRCGAAWQAETHVCASTTG